MKKHKKYNKYKKNDKFCLQCTLEQDQQEQEWEQQEQQQRSDWYSTAVLKIDRQLAGQSSLTPFMSIKEGHNFYLAILPIAERAP